MTILLPDTNFFLQYRDPVEIPWTDISVGDEVTLMVCRAVLREIDAFKAGGNARRARRARDMSSRFRQMLKDKKPLVLRQANPKVMLSFAPRPPPDFVAPQALDLNKPDDRIVAEAIAILQALGQEGALLTDDTGAMLTADEVQLAYVATPESWRLPSEKDERDKQIDELKGQVARLSRSAPQLSVEVLADGKAPTEPLLVRRIEYPPLSPEVVEELTKALEAYYPMRTDFARESDPDFASTESLRLAAQQSVVGLAVHHGLGRYGEVNWEPPSDDSIDAYRESYGKWLVRLRQFFETLHAALPGRVGRAALTFLMENTGSAPADLVLVHVEALGGLLLRERPAKDASIKSPLALPAVPASPTWKTGTKGRLSGTVASLEAMLGSRQFLAQAAAVNPVPIDLYTGPQTDDDHRFYWRDRPSTAVANWEFRCGEFRHQAPAETFATLVIARPDGTVEKGAVRFRASARNLPELIERTVAVRVEVVVGSTEVAARALIPAPRMKPALKGQKPGD